MRRGQAKGGGEEGERMLFHRRTTTRKSHFSQCINLPRNGEEGRMEERRSGGEGEMQRRIKWARVWEKGAPVDRSLEKAPHSPAGSCSALVLPVQCWWGSCPPPTTPEDQPHTSSPPPPCAPNCPAYSGATATAWTQDLNIWRPDHEACSTAGALQERAAQRQGTTRRLSSPTAFSLLPLLWTEDVFTQSVCGRSVNTDH